MPVREPRRPDPTLRFTDPRQVPGGALAANAIPNEALRPASIPRRGAPWEAVQEFALSYDGNGYWSGLAVLAGRTVQGWTRDRSLPDTLDELRACLFYEQRRWHHFGQEPHGRSADYLEALLGAISDQVRQIEQKPAKGAPPAARAG
jgi:hypothetical protein